jgi:hypothetical protein
LWCAASVCLGQQDKTRHFQIQDGESIAAFDRALALRCVETGIPGGVAVKTEVLVELKQGGIPKREWQVAGSHNARFYVDAPKVRVVPDKPVMYSPGAGVTIPAKRGMRFFAGSHGELTNDLIVPVMLTQTGDKNWAGYSYFLTSSMKGASEFFESSSKLKKISRFKSSSRSLPLNDST